LQIIQEKAVVTNLRAVPPYCFFFLDGLAYEINAMANCLKHLPRLNIQKSFVTKLLDWNG